MLSPYSLSKLNMSRSILPFHQNTYPLYFSAWIAANRLTPACGIVIAIDSFWCSIFARSFYLSIWFDCFVTNSNHGLISGTSSKRTLCMVAYPPCLRMLSIGMTLAVGGKATRWRLCEVASTIFSGNVHQAIDLTRLQLFVNGFRHVANRFVVMMTSVNAASLGQCAFCIWSICFLHSKCYRAPHCPGTFNIHSFMSLPSTCYCKECPSPSVSCPFLIW